MADHDDLVSTSLAEFCDGRVSEDFSDALDEVIANVQDTETDPTKVRKVALVFKVRGNRDRTALDVDFECKVSLQPAMPIETSLFLKRAPDGRIVAIEPEQQKLDFSVTTTSPAN